MRILPSHIATTVLVHMIFSWSSKGTHLAPLENNDIHVHLHTLHFQSFRTRIIHFVPKSFRSKVISHNVVHFVPYSLLALLDVDLWSFTEVDLSGVRPFVSLSVHMFVDGPEFFSVLAQFDIERNILTKF